MIKVKAIEDFSLGDFNKLKNIVRANVEKEGKLYKGDIFECDEDMAKYLTGGNALGKTVVEILEFEPFVVEAKYEEIKKDKKGKKKNGK